MTRMERVLEKYDYAFPEELIAQAPAAPRDSARLLVYDRAKDEVSFGRFADLAGYLPKNAVLVFNKTKVLPARLVLTKLTGGRVKVIYLETKGSLIKVMADRKLAIGSTLRLTPKISFIVSRQEERFYFLKPSFPLAGLFPVLEKYGITPIPPYIKHSPLKERDLRKKYQTVFAESRGSVAAPTASLHFTERLLEKLKKSGVAVRFITLHVNLGTFAPLTEEQLESGTLHSEYYEISGKDADFLNVAKKSGRPIIAVGTTSVRALESAASVNGKIRAAAGFTDMFIREGYAFKFVDGMITNFHVPKSSLLMLVASLIGRKRLLALYALAIRKKCRLFSFGDGMLILPAHTPR